MEVIIEAENNALVTDIRTELDLFIKILSGINANLNISRIIITPNFEEKVNEILEISGYQARHGSDSSAVQAVAKIISQATK